MDNIRDCSKCVFRKKMASSTKGVKIPDGTGKCTHPDGHCDPDIVCGGIGENNVYRRTPEILRKKAELIRETANHCDDPDRYRSELRTAEELERKADDMERRLK